MERYLAEKFLSINGEGKYAGLLSCFIRFTGCNLRCSYCDTAWAYDTDLRGEKISDEKICEYIRNTGALHVTLTGGEPLLQKNIAELIDKIHEIPKIICEIETNGSVDISEALKVKHPERLTFTMDYKLPSSGSEGFMNMKNFRYLRLADTVKFVVGSEKDLQKAGQIIEKYCLQQKCSTYLSPVFGKIEPKRLAEFLIDKKLNNVHVQVQLHKILWDPAKRGV